MISFTMDRFFIVAFILVALMEYFIFFFIFYLSFVVFYYACSCALHSFLVICRCVYDLFEQDAWAQVVYMLYGCHGLRLTPSMSCYGLLV